MSVSMEKASASLRHAKQSVLATIAGARGMTPPVVTAPGPIVALPPEVAATAAARLQDGLSLYGTDSPGRSVISRVVLPSVALAVLDAVLLVIALVSGNGVLAAVAAVLLIVFAGSALLGWRATAADPLRFRARDRVAIVSAARWRSRQRWTGPIASTPECALVVAAARAAQRIVSSRAWASGELVRGGVPLAIAAELDQVDANAFELATHRYAEFPGGLPGPPVSTPELDDAWDKTLTRVAALTAYADTVDGLSERQHTALQHPVPFDDIEIELSDRDVLAFFLSAAIYDVG